MGLPSYMCSAVDRNVVMRHMTVHYVVGMKLNLNPTWKADNDLAGDNFLVDCEIVQSTAANNTLFSNTTLSHS